MGCSSSCRMFSAFTDSIVHILRERYGVEYVVKILDDFLFIAKSREECQRSLNALLNLCKSACIPVAPHKTINPCWCIIFLGTELDTKSMEARLPIDKLQKYSKHIHEIIGKGKITLKELQSVNGQLQYATCVVHSGWAFLRRLINLTIGRTVPYVYVTLNKGARLDLKIWILFLEKFNGISLLYEPHVADSQTVNLFYDASMKGFGACYGWVIMETKSLA